MPIINSDGDRGLQLERTRLAWRRTTLAATVVALLAVGRVVAVGAEPAAVIGLVLIAAAWLAILTVAFRRIRALTPDSTSDGRSAPRHSAATRSILSVGNRAPAVVALLTAALALVGTLLLG